MKRYNILKIEEIVSPEWPSHSIEGGKRYPALPIEYTGFIQRFLSAWEVFRGRARAVTWPTPQEPSHD